MALRFRVSASWITTTIKPAGLSTAILSATRALCTSRAPAVLQLEERQLEQVHGLGARQPIPPPAFQWYFTITAIVCKLLS